MGKNPLLYKKWCYVLWCCTLLIPEGNLFSSTGRSECKLGAGGPGPLLECLSVQPLVHSAAWKNRGGLSSHQFLCRITFLPFAFHSGFFDTSHLIHPCFPEPSICLAVSVSVFLGSWEAAGVLCIPVPRRFANPGAPGPQWHCSMWPIVCDPGSGGNSWWILQYQPAWHRDRAQGTV